MADSTPQQPEQEQVCLELAAIVNHCSICKLSFSTSKELHRQTEFHKMNMKSSHKLSLEEYARRKHLSIAQVKQRLTLAAPREVHVPIQAQIQAAKAPSHVKDDQFVAKGVVIRQTIQEHSHNNHHGLPGANKYSHRGPCSAPGQNNMFRGKKN